MTNIERLRSGEGDRLRAVRLRGLADAPDAFGSTVAESSTRTPQQWEDQIRTLATFVAVDAAGHDVGLVRGAPDESDASTAWLISMWVAPEARGRGVGAALTNAVVGWAHERGCARVALDVADHNRHAIALYERMGFRATGETGTLPAPREHITEHRRVLELHERNRAT